MQMPELLRVGSSFVKMGTTWLCGNPGGGGSEAAKYCSVCEASWLLGDRTALRDRRPREV